MRIVADASNTKRSLQSAREKIRLKMQSMVSGFIEETAEGAQDITPLGDHGTTYHKSGTGATSWYSFRSTIGWVQDPGLAKAGWQVTLGNNMIRFNPLDNKFQNTLDKVTSVMQSYKLGQDVFLGNAVPYIMNEGVNMTTARRSSARGGGALDKGYSPQAPDGISGPLTALMQVYKLNLKSHYDAGG